MMKLDKKEHSIEEVIILYDWMIYYHPYHFYFEFGKANAYYQVCQYYKAEQIYIALLKKESNHEKILEYLAWT